MGNKDIWVVYCFNIDRSVLFMESIKLPLKVKPGCIILYIGSEEECEKYRKEYSHG